MTPDRPWVTAVVPTYNSTGHIDKTLAALEAQTWPNLRILLGDDASPDGTATYLADYVATRPNASLIARDTNLGWMGNINDLMDRADTPYVFFMPHDDIIAPTYVERLVTALEANPNAIIAISDVRVTTDDGTTQIVQLPGLTGVQSPLKRALHIFKRGPGWWIPHRGIFRTRAVPQIGGLKPNDAGDFCADFAWIFHMVLLGEVVRTPEVLYDKVFGTKNVSLNYSRPAKPKRVLAKAALAELRASPLPPLHKAALATAMLTHLVLKAIRWRLQGRAHHP